MEALQDKLNHLNGPAMDFWRVRNADIDTKLIDYANDEKQFKYYTQSKKNWQKELEKLNKDIEKLNKKLSKMIKA